MCYHCKKVVFRVKIDSIYSNFTIFAAKIIIYGK